MTTHFQFTGTASVRRATVALAATLFTASPASAQVSGPKTIPTVLAQSMLGEFGAMMGGLVFVVGKTPDHWPKALVAPAQARIVGGGKFGPILTAVYEYPSNGDAVGSFESEMLKAGFKKAVATGFPSENGFASSTSSAPAHSFCGDAGAAGFQQVDSTKDARTIAVVFVADKESSSTCSTRANRPGEPPLKIPTLRPPPGVHVTPGGYSAGGDNFISHMRVDTTFTAAEILTHYAKELTAGGWQVSPKPALGDGVALQQVSMRDEKGNAWRGALIVVTATSQREVSLHMVRDSAH